MSMSREELLELSVKPNTYTSTFDFNAEMEGSTASLGDALTHGLAASVVSGGVGLVNTGIAITNMFGADVEQIRTEDLLKSWDWEDTADYYEDNKAFIDGVGYVASSLIPGTLGLKAAKYAQTAARASDSKNLAAVAIRKILVPASASKKIGAEILEDTMHVANRSKRLASAVKQGAHQAAIETAFAETAILMATNQHVTVNQNQLGYFEAMYDQKDGYFMGLGIGTTLGGAVYGAVNNRAINSLIDGAQKEHNAINKELISLDSRTNRIGFNQGNKIVQLAAKQKDAEARLEGLTGAALKEAQRRDKEFNADLVEEVAVLVGEAGTRTNALGRREIDGHLTPAIVALIKKGDKHQVADAFRNANSIGKYDDHDFLFDPLAQPIEILDTADEYLAAIGSKHFGTKYDPEDAVQRGFLNGFANSRGVSITGDAPRIREQLLNRELINERGITDALDPAHLVGTLRHEIGHGNTVALGQIFSSEVFSSIRNEMIALSKIQRPGSWAVVERNRVAMERILAQKTISPTDYQRIAELQKTEAYLNDPMELMADAWAQFNAADKKMRSNAESIGAATRKLFQDNRALKSRLGESQRLIGLNSGNIYTESQWSPTMADRGNVVMRGDNVIAGDYSTTTNLENFSVLSADPMSASAHFYAASQSKRKLKKEVAFNWDNFAMMNKLHGEVLGGWKGKASITMPDGSVRKLDGEFDEAVLTDFDALYTAFKSTAAQRLTQRQLNKTHNYTTSDIARMIDTDEVFALELGEGAKSTKYWTQSNDPTKPTVAKIFYKNPVDASEGGAEALADSIAQNTKVLEVVDDSINTLLKRLDDMGDGITQSNLLQTAPEPSWKYGGNGDLQDITRNTQITGVLRTFAPEYGSGLSKAQSIAKFNELTTLKGHELIQTAIAGAATRVQANPSSIMELNALDSKLRQRFYKFSPVLPDGQAQASYMQGLIKSTDEEQIAISLKNIEKLTGSATGNKLFDLLSTENSLWSREVSELVAKIVNQKRFIPSNLTKLGTMLDEQVTSIQSPDVASFWRAKVSANALIVEAKQVAASARGISSNLSADVLYPGGLDARKYKHRFYVEPVNNEVWSHNQKGIIGANTSQELAQKEAQVRAQFGDSINIRTKEDMEAGFKERGEYIEEFSLNEYQSNADLTRKGVNWDVAPEANANLVQHYVDSMAREWKGTVDNLTELKYGEEFAALDQMDGVSQTYGTLGAGKQQPITTPFRETKNIMLNRTSKETGNSWRDGQQAIDKTITAIFQGLGSAFSSASRTGNYEEMSKYMDHYGLPKVYEGQTGNMLRTSPNMTDQKLRSIVPKANGIAATMMLRLDYIQPMINAMSMPIMSVPEMNALMKSIPAIKAQQVAKGLHVTVPDTAFGMGSNIKLQMQAVKDYFGESGKALLKSYRDQGIITNVVREMRQVVDDITLDVTQDADTMIAQLAKGGKKMVNIAASPADWMEDFVKFVAARQADLVMDAAGITDQSLRASTLRTYTTRVHGNYVSAQRPTIFQGFAGQAIGLFQTYQFNLIQSLLGKVGNKDAVGVASMMGIQAGMFGVQSVPGFKALNDHISLNSQDGNDFYTGITTATGKNHSEWILYGLASNFTKPLFGEGLELYTRGDLNPRTPFLIPTSIDEVPAWSLASKFVGNIFNAASDLSQGVNAGQVMADSLAHNGVNRPLAGVGAIMAGSRTTGNGSLITDLSDISWFAKAARVLGTKTLDESIAVQSFYRTQGFDSLRTDKITDLGRGAKRMIQSGNYDKDTYMNFMDSYTTSGGKPEKFNQWLHTQSLGATESTIQQLYESNDSASGRYLQKIMGNDVGNYIDGNL